MAGCPKTVLLSWLFVTPPHVLRHACGSYNTPATAPQCCNVGRGLGSSAFAHRYSQNLFWCLFLRVIRCFNSPGIASLAGSLRFAQRGSPIRKSTDQCLFTTPRRLSQQTTSFFACRCLGIPRTLLITWPYYFSDISQYPIFLHNSRLQLSCGNSRLLALDLSYGFLLDISHKLSQHTPHGMCILDEIFNYI